MAVFVDWFNGGKLIFVSGLFYIKLAVLRGFTRCSASIGRSVMLFSL